MVGVSGMGTKFRVRCFCPNSEPSPLSFLRLDALALRSSSQDDGVAPSSPNLPTPGPPTPPLRPICCILRDVCFTCVCVKDLIPVDVSCTIHIRISFFGFVRVFTARLPGHSALKL